jgi:hypothetical protein
VLNKTDASNIIVNSVKGLTILTPNINNLPFQVCWDKNRIFRAVRILSAELYSKKNKHAYPLS